MPQAGLRPCDNVPMKRGKRETDGPTNGSDCVILCLVLGVLAFVFWIRMIIDCVKNEPEGNDKLVWILVIIFAGIVGALIYHFLRRPQRRALLRS